MTRPQIWFGLLVLVAACGDPGVGPREAVEGAFAMSRAGLRAAASDLARTTALQLRDAQVRASLLRAFEESPYLDAKVSWNAYVGGSGLRLLRAIAADARGLTATQRLLTAFRDLEIYMPVVEHRARWAGGEDLIVTVYLDDAYGREGWVGFDLRGNEVKLSLAGPPKTPVLVILRPEGLLRRRPGPERAQACPEDDCGGGGGGGGGGGAPIPAPSGYFMVDWRIGESYESWTAGSPEFEIVAWRWTGQWGPTANGGRLPILRDSIWTCTSGDYHHTDPRDWYYNSPPEKHYASEYGSSGIEILNADEVFRFPGRPGIPILMVTENDDLPCAEGGFPTAWDPYWPHNNDELVGAITFTNLLTRSNVRFYHDGDDIPIARATLSFVRR